MFASPLNPFLVTQHLTHVVMFIIITITKFLESDRLSTALISALIGQFNKTVRIIAKQLDSTHITHALKWFFFSLLATKILEFLVFGFQKEPYISQFLVNVMINW